jgi:hypothetical protein
MSTIGHEELYNLQEDIQFQQLNSEEDIWSPSWGDYFSMKRMYNKLIGDQHTPKPILDSWNTCNFPRQKFFAWLMVNNRLNTKDMMMKKNFYVEFSEWPNENIMHLFFECSFSQKKLVGYWHQMES